MNLLRAILNKIAAELRLQRLGRCALREVRFAKYKVAPQKGDRLVRERVLRRLPQRLEHTTLGTLTTC